MDRTSLIEERLSQHLIDIGAAPRVLPKDEWDGVEAFNGTLRKQVGFIPPHHDDDWAAFFCPELIAEQTQVLDDHQLDEYLAAVEWIIDKEIELYTLTPEDRQMAADAALAEIAPGSLQLMSDIHMRWLDAGH